MMKSFHGLIVLYQRVLSIVVAVIISLGLIAGASSSANAAESAKGIYLLGSNASLVGLMPPPGTYGANIKYFYSGDASGAAADGVALEKLGNITLEADIDVDVELFIDILTAIRVTQHKILGGQLGFGVLLPIGWQDISVDVEALATLTLPNGRTFARGAMFGFEDDTFNFGDPLLTAFLGWNRGNWHWKATGLLNIPIGDYDKNDIVNMGFNRWAFDASSSVTWLNAQKGHEVSVITGFTFNGENDDTNYEMGTEFHAEFALMQHFSPALAAGLAGYHYQQVTGDSGAGATLGSFKGRTTAIGPNVHYNFKWGQTPVSTTVRWLHEFNAKNRLEGDAVFFSATIPLGGPRQ